MSPAKRRQHVLELVDEAAAVLIVDEDYTNSLGESEAYGGRPHGWSYKESPFEGAPTSTVVAVTHDPGESKAAYLVALHELGHLYENCEEEQVSEAFAWRWAVTQSKERIDAEAWGEIAWYLRTYINPEFDCLLREAERKAA